MAEIVAKTLVAGWISRFGCPQQIINDQGRQFTSQLFQALSRICDIHISKTTYHPAANGLAERLHHS